MSGPTAPQLSSNWKKLQETLKPEKKTEATSNGLKRKREESKKKSSTSNCFKKTKLSGANAGKIENRRKMGGFMSKATTDSNAPASRAAKLIQDHDIAPEDISAAYGTTAAPRKSSHADEGNGGLHSTHKIGKYVSLDCEMVGTGPPPHADNVLARASLVNFHGEQIYDSYVQPPPGIRVEDYRTYVSGIKPHHMKPGYARTFAEVQKDVARILDGRILVGHALRNDLNALLLSHPKRDLRDTSRHPKFRVESKGKPPALRNLAKSELGIDIQTGEHSSVEDARAAMLLFQKEKKGFEEENRRHFGTKRLVAVKETVKGKVREETLEIDNDDEGDDNEDDELDMLDGEDNEEALDEMLSRNTPAQPKAKKRKKKKRTKRN